MSDVIIGNFMQLLATTYEKKAKEEIVHETTFKTLKDTEANKFQNASLTPISANTFMYDGEIAKEDFQFLSFIYQGATRSRDGDNLQASIIMSFNALTISSVEHIVSEKIFIRITSLLLEREPDKITVDGQEQDNSKAGELKVSTSTDANGDKYEKTISEEIWVATSFTYDDTSIEIQLTSPMDAVQAFTPHRVLNSQEVGVLPVTGNLQNL